MKLALTLISLSTFSFLRAQDELDFQWAKQFAGGEVITTTSILDFDHNIITTGSFSGTVDFDPSSNVSNMSTSSTDVPNIFVTKLNPSGELIWTKQFESDQEGYSYSSHSVEADNSGNIYLTGTYYGTVDFDPSPLQHVLVNSFNEPSSFVVKLDSNGNFIWVKDIKGIDLGSSILSWDLALDDLGNIYTTGTYSGTVDFNSGTEILTSIGYYSAFILKVSNDGDFIWVNGIGKSPASSFTYNQCLGKQLEVNNNSLYLLGLFYGSVDFDTDSNGDFVMSTPDNNEQGAYWANTESFVCKFDLSCNLVEAIDFDNLSLNNFVDSCKTELDNINFDSSGNVYLTGTSIGSIDADASDSEHLLHGGDFLLVGRTPFITKYNSNLNFMWGHQFTNDSINYSGNISGVSIDASDDLYLTGQFSGQIDFDASPSDYYLETTIGDEQTYICKLNSDGEIIFAEKLIRNVTSSNQYILTKDILIDQNQIYITGLFSFECDFEAGVEDTFLQAEILDQFIVKYLQTGVSNSIEEFNANAYNIHPNPTKSFFVIENHDFSSLDIQIFNTNGNLVFENKSNNNLMQIDASTWNPGLYFIEVKTEKEIIHHKIIKQ